MIQIEANGNNLDESLKNFSSSCNTILNKHVPKKKKYVRGKQSPFMNKTLSKVIMQRSKLRKLFLKKRTEENKNNYVKQRNLCVTLLQKSETQMRHTCVIIRNFEVWLSIYCHIKLFIMKNDKNTASILNEFSLIS